MEIEEEDWIAYVKRSTREAQEQMKKANVPCWIETHRRMKWRMVMRLASLPEEWWSRKTAEWNPGLDNSIKTNSSVGRPRTRWEDEINEFIKTEETEDSKGHELKKQRHMATASKAAKRMESKRRRIRKKQQRQEELKTNRIESKRENICEERQQRNVG